MKTAKYHLFQCSSFIFMLYYIEDLIFLVTDSLNEGRNVGESGKYARRAGKVECICTVIG